MAVPIDYQSNRTFSTTGLSQFIFFLSRILITNLELKQKLIQLLKTEITSVRIDLNKFFNQFLVNLCFIEYLNIGIKLNFF